MLYLSKKLLILQSLASVSLALSSCSSGSPSEAVHIQQENPVIEKPAGEKPDCSRCNEAAQILQDKTENYILKLVRLNVDVEKSYETEFKGWSADLEFVENTVNNEKASDQERYDARMKIRYLRLVLSKERAGFNVERRAYLYSVNTVISDFFKICDDDIKDVKSASVSLYCREVTEMLKDSKRGFVEGFHQVFDISESESVNSIEMMDVLAQQDDPESLRKLLSGVESSDVELIRDLTYTLWQKMMDMSLKTEQLLKRLNEVDQKE